MMRDLLYLRSELFGFGWVFAVWLAGSLGLLAWAVARHGWREALGYLPVLAIVGAVIIWVLPAMAGENGLPIRGYGAMLVAGIVSSVWLAMTLARRLGVDPEIILGMSFWVILSGIAGARTFYVAEYWDDFQAETLGETIKNLVNVTEGGLVVYGGAIGGFAAMAAYLVLHRLPALAIADICARHRPGIILRPHRLLFERMLLWRRVPTFPGPCSFRWIVRRICTNCAAARLASTVCTSTGNWMTPPRSPRSSRAHSPKRQGCVRDNA